ncbi:MAG: helix-turn-helix domain-containing protein [Verrucomicrobiota bacterium]
MAKRRPKEDLPFFSIPEKAEGILVASPEIPAATPLRPAPPRPVFNPMYSVGHQLMKARQARNLAIEDVAFETRIPHQRLSEMENDDLSNFANLTYAKGFLKLYSKYLDLDLSDYLDEFDTSAIAAVTGHEYIQTASAVRILSAPALAPDQSPGGRSNLAALAVMAAVVVLGGWLFMRSKPAPALPDPNRATPPDSTSQVVPATMKAPVPPPSEASPALAIVNSKPLVERAVASPPSVPAAEVINTAAPGDKVRRATVVDDEGNEIAPIVPARL